MEEERIKIKRQAAIDLSIAMIPMIQKYKPLDIINALSENLMKATILNGIDRSIFKEVCQAMVDSYDDYTDHVNRSIDIINHISNLCSEKGDEE